MVTSRLLPDRVNFARKYGRTTIITCIGPMTSDEFIYNDDSFSRVDFAYFSGVFPSIIYRLYFTKNAILVCVCVKINSRLTATFDFVTEPIIVGYVLYKLNVLKDLGISSFYVKTITVHRVYKRSECNNIDFTPLYCVESAFLIFFNL